MMTMDKAIAVIAMWDTRRFSTHDIALLLGIRECDAERVIHIRREAARGVAVA